MCHWAGHDIDATPVFRAPKAENVRTDCHRAVRLVRLELMPQKGSARGRGDEQRTAENSAGSVLRFVQPHNVITLSCKSRLPRRPQLAARRLPRLTRSGRSELAADVTRACSWSRPKAA